MGSASGREPGAEAVDPEPDGATVGPEPGHATPDPASASAPGPGPGPEDVSVDRVLDRVLGGVTFVPDGGPMADIARPGEAEIRMLAVAPDARGRGAGEALVRACVDRARATEGCVRVVLSTQRTMHTAHRIYQRLGFTRAPERDWNPIPHLDDILLLTYELTLRHTP
ncbi:GNAT family N-acetyltransferase [Streptomyces sp. NPDC058272]|uniref:GNAT family N-acetyltransferase n=1 Tax=Streptomyces sp. NPDC058272 TaxID=3346415 RepID=UPI0036E2AC3D